MPATGLPDVKQKIGVEYDNGYQKIADDARGFAKASEEAMKTVSGLSEQVRNSISAIKSASDAIRDAVTNMLGIQRATKDYEDALSAARDQAVSFGDAHRRNAEQLRTVTEATGAHVTALQNQASAQQTAADMARETAESHLRETETRKRSAESIRSYAKDLEQLKDTAKAANSALADTAAAVSAVKSSGGEGWTPAALAAAAAGNAARSGSASIPARYGSGPVLPGGDDFRRILDDAMLRMNRMQAENGNRLADASNSLAGMSRQIQQNITQAVGQVSNIVSSLPAPEDFARQAQANFARQPRLNFARQPRGAAPSAGGGFPQISSWELSGPMREAEEAAAKEAAIRAGALEAAASASLREKAEGMARGRTTNLMKRLDAAMRDYREDPNLTPPVAWNPFLPDRGGVVPRQEDLFRHAPPSFEGTPIWPFRSDYARHVRPIGSNVPWDEVAASLAMPGGGGTLGGGPGAGGGGAGGLWLPFGSGGGGGVPGAEGLEGLWAPRGASGGGSGGGGPGGGTGAGGGGRGRGRWTSAAYAEFGGGAGFPAGTAGHDASVIIGAVKRWWTPVHFAIMTVNELLATAVPALTALGAAAAVSAEGVQQIIPRFAAIGTTASALGNALGISAGQYIGTGGALQRAQHYAAGGAYELTGAGINMLASGKGAFAQTGISTLSMINRGVADMQLNMKARGTGDLLSGMMGRGTDYLRQFGDIGSNIGNILLGLAPHLPGVGDDYLGVLEGATGAFSGGLGFMNQHGMGNLIGATMATEAGWRIGRPTVGLAGRGISGLGRLAGRFPGGLLGRAGLSVADVAAISAETGVEGIAAGGTGLAGLLAGGGEALGLLGGPEIAGLALSAFLGTKLVGSMPTAAQRQVAGMQSRIGQSGFSAALAPLAKAIVTTRGLSSRDAGQSLLAQEQQVETPYEIGRFGPGITPTYSDTYKAGAQGFGQTMDNLVKAGPDLVSALHKAGLKSVSMGEAFQIAQNALLDTTHAFDKHGKLNAQAQGMLANYVSGIAPMTKSGGAFNAAVQAQQIMSSPQMKSLSQINSAMDSMTQIMSGGPAGMATLFGMLGGTPTTVSHGGMKLQPPPAIKAMAQALTSFSSAKGAAAWNTFAGSSGLVAAEQQNLDQLRTAMTLGAVGPGGAAGLAGFQLQQMLPLARKSPAALAMLMQQGQQMGIGGFYQGDPNKAGVQQQNYQNAVRAFGGIADNVKQADAATNSMTVKLSNLPHLAAQFSQSINADVMSKRAADIASSYSKVTAAAHGGRIDTGGIKTMTEQLKIGFGGNTGAVKAQIQSLLASSGLSAGMQKKIMIQVDADVGAARAKINGLHGKQITISAAPAGMQGVQAAINAIHGKTVTITINTINRVLTQVIGALTPAGGVAPATFAGSGAPNMRITRGQTGMFIPGYGGGDIHPAMLEAGELVVPKHLVGSVAPVLRGKIPGFAGGGGFGVMGFETMLQQAFHGEAVSSSMRQLVDMILGSEIQKFPRTVNLSVRSDGGNPASQGHDPNRVSGTSEQRMTQLAREAAAQAAVAIAAAAKGAAGMHFGVEVIKGLTDGIKNAKGAAKSAATAMMNHISQEISYAKQTAQSLTQGVNFGGMDTTQGPVQTQMKSYADSLKTFGGDIRSMSKAGLNKDLLKQMIAAGPVQGDLLAKSIQQGPGGVKAVNQLYSQIQKMSKGIAAQGAQSIYGGKLSPDLKSGTFINNNVSISVSVGGGGGDLSSLTTKQLSELVAKIQAALLKQAKRNRKTGITLPNKKA